MSALQQLMLQMRAPTHATGPAPSEHTQPKRAKWSSAEDQLLRDHYTARGVAWCQRQLNGRTRRAVMQRAMVIGANGRRRRWSPDEDATLLAAWLRGGFKRCAQTLPNRTLPALRLRVHLLLRRERDKAAR